MSEANEIELACNAALGELWRLRHADIGDDLLDRDAVVRATLPRCARALRARRAGLWLFDADRTTLVAAAIYDRPADRWSAGETVAAVDHPRLWAVLGLDRPRRDLGGRSAGEPAPGAEVAAEAVRAGHWSIAAAPVGEAPAGGVLWCEPDDDHAPWTRHQLVFVELAGTILAQTLARVDEEIASRAADRLRVDQLTALQAAIDVAFDGVPVPDDPHPTIHAAEAADWPTSSTYTPSRDHRGRWQDLPRQHLRECPFALSRLDAEGLHYYLPAIMTAAIRRELESPDDETPDDHPFFLIERLGQLLTPDSHDTWRAQACELLRLLTRPQRAVVGEYVRLTMSSGLPSATQAQDAWARVAAHDRAPGPGSWFDAWWPAGDRP